MKLDNTRFGSIEFEEIDIIDFRDGLIGFPESKRYLILNAKEESPFRWLQSIEQPTLAFLVVEPGAYLNAYAPEVAVEVATELGLCEDRPALVYTTAAIPPGKPEELTLNLAAPIVINPENRIAAQVVIEDPSYTIRHRVFQDAVTDERLAA